MKPTEKEIILAISEVHSGNGIEAKSIAEIILNLLKKPTEHKNMKLLLLEIRDRATFIPVFAMKMMPATSIEEYLLLKTGYGYDLPLVLLGRIEGGSTEYTPDSWNDRTFTTAHKYITENFDSMQTGDVVDVEFILGETTTKKISQRFED